MKEEIALQSRASPEAQVRRFVDDAWPLNPDEETPVKFWRAAGRSTLLVLLAFSGIQYYFLDVYLTIMALPSVTLVAGLP